MKKTGCFQGQKKREPETRFPFNVWCRSRDLNPDELPHYPLKIACLPDSTTSARTSQHKRKRPISLFRCFCHKNLKGMLLGWRSRRRSRRGRNDRRSGLTNRLLGCRFGCLIDDGVTFAGSEIGKIKRRQHEDHGDDRGDFSQEGSGSAAAEEGGAGAAEGGAHVGASAPLQQDNQY